MGAIGRNDACPCGSGKKYKRCHLTQDDAARARAAAPSPLHTLDERLVTKLLRRGREQFGKRWAPEAAYPGRLDEAAYPLFAVWAAYHFRVEGETIAGRYLGERLGSPPDAELTWLASQLRAWLGMWEVKAVVPGASLVVHDLLTGEERVVRESGASTQLVSHDVILARIVDHEGESLLCGLHPSPLRPRDGAQVAREVRARLGVGSGRVSLARLARPDATDTLLQVWEEMVVSIEGAPMPKLQNTDGDPLLLVTDHFVLQPGTSGDARTRLLALEGAGADGASGAAGAIGFVRRGHRRGEPLEDTVIGRAELAADRLRLETNSIARADALRKRVEAACRDLVTHQTRTTQDPTELLGSPPLGPPPPPVEPTPEMVQVQQEFMRRYYANWLDSPVPILGGETPREAAGRPRKRKQVELLLKEIEHAQARRPESERIDFSPLWVELGLRPPAPEPGPGGARAPSTPADA